MSNRKHLLSEQEISTPFLESHLIQAKISYRERRKRARGLIFVLNKSRIILLCLRSHGLMDGKRKMEKSINLLLQKWARERLSKGRLPGKRLLEGCSLFYTILCQGRN